MKKRLFLMGALLSSLFYLYPQQNNFINYNVREGLPNSTILKIQEDDRGYLWLGTNGAGICQFNGKDFSVFTRQDGLSGSRVWEIFSDSRGRLWIGTENGVTVYDGHTFDTIIERMDLLGTAVFSICEDSNNHIWLGTLGNGLYRINEYNKDSVSFDHISREEGLLSYNVYAVHHDRFNRIWAGTELGINIYPYAEDDAELQSISNWLPARDITSIAEDSMGNLWFGSQSGGIFRMEINADGSMGQMTPYNTESGLRDNDGWCLSFDKDDKLWIGSRGAGISIFDGEHFEYFDVTVGLPGNTIYDIFQDNEGNIWFGMLDDGLGKFLGYHFSHLGTEEGLPDNNVYPIAQDYDGNLWIGTISGGLLKISLSGNEPLYQYYNTENGLLENYITSICITPDNSVWIGYNESGISRLRNNRLSHFTRDNGLYSDNISCLLLDAEGRIWYGTSEGFSFMRQQDPFFTSIYWDSRDLISGENVRTMMQDSRGLLWIGLDGGVSVLDLEGSNSYNYDHEEGLVDKQVSSLVEDSRGDIWIGTMDGGLYKFHYQEKDSMPIRKVAGDELLASNFILSLMFSDENNLIIGLDKGMNRLTLDDEGKILRVTKYDETNGFFGIENNLNAIYKDDNDNIWMGTVNGLTRYSPYLEDEKLSPPIIHLTDILLREEPVDWVEREATKHLWFNIPEELILRHSENIVSFRFDALAYSNATRVKYRVMCEGLDEDYGPVTEESEIIYRGLSPGHYTLKVLAENGNGVWTKDPMEYPFVIKPPFWLRWWFISILVILIAFIIIAYIKYREKQLIEEKKILEQKVEERTVEIRKKNEILSEQNIIIEEANREIKASIRAAKRIQFALLPSEVTLSKYMDDYFILFKPRDIVSGDFYWVKQTDHKLVVVAADCTGHGVPGAFMSLLGMSYLDDIVEKEGVTEAGQILNHLRQDVIDALHQSDESETKEGMDMSVCTFDLDLSTVQYAGANNALYIIREGDTEIEEVKADRMPVAIYAELRDFTTNELELKKGDCIYMFSDGFPDQFGGPRNKKYKYKPFKELLQEIVRSPMEEQKQILDDTLEAWRGDNEQVDDIVIIGLKY